MFATFINRVIYKQFIRRNFSHKNSFCSYRTRVIIKSNPRMMLFENTVFVNFIDICNYIFLTYVKSIEPILMVIYSRYD